MKDVPAFPTGTGVTPYNAGMTLRDYFAAKAMSSVLPAVILELKKTRGSVKEAVRLNSLAAETCYAMADAMMKARTDGL